jgi:O-antigen/teichoic acid export membrane protein
MLSSIRLFFKQTFIYGLVGSFRSLIEFLLLPIYARYLLPSEFGKLDLILVYTAVITVGVIFELTNGVFRFYYDDTSADYRRRLVSTITYYHIAISALTAFVIWLYSGEISGLLLGTTASKNLIILAGLTLFLNCAFTLPLNLFRLQNRPGMYSLISFVQIGTAVAATVLFVAYRNLGVEGVILARLLALMPTLVFCFWVQRSELKPQIDFAILLKIARYAAPLIPVGSAIWIINALNRFFLLRYSTLEQVGYFSVGLKFTIFITLMVMAFQLAWPQFAYSKIDNHQAKAIFARIFSYYGAASLWVVIFIGFFGESLIRFQASTAYLPAASLMVPLSLAMMFYGIFYIFTTGLNISRKTPVILFPIGLGLVSNISLNIIFTSQYGSLAVAWNTLVTYSVMALITFVLAQRTYYIPFEWLKLGRSALAAILIWFAPRMIPPDIGFNFGYKIIAFLSYPLLLGLFGFFDRVERKAIISRFTIKHGQEVTAAEEHEYTDSHFG